MDFGVEDEHTTPRRLRQFANFSQFLNFSQMFLEVPSLSHRPKTLDVQTHKFQPPQFK